MLNVLNSKNVAGDIVGRRWGRGRGVA